MEVIGGAHAKIIFLSKLFIEKKLEINYLILKIVNVLVLLQQMLSLLATIKTRCFHMIPQEIGVIAKSLDTSGLACKRVQEQ